MIVNCQRSVLPRASVGTVKRSKWWKICNVKTSTSNFGGEVEMLGVKISKPRVEIKVSEVESEAELEIPIVFSGLFPERIQGTLLLLQAVHCGSFSSHW